MLDSSATVPLSVASRDQIVNHSSALLVPGDILPDEVFADLRTDHAGEVGAVCIYQGVLQFARDPVLRAFAEHHLVTEQKHLLLIAGWLPRAEYSRLLHLWRLAGFLTGALPALFGPKAVYATIEAVETTVVVTTTIYVAPIRYVVQLGDTLFGIAETNRLDMRVLMEMNGISDPDRVEAGQELIFPPANGFIPVAPSTTMKP